MWSKRAFSSCSWRGVQFTAEEIAQARAARQARDRASRKQATRSITLYAAGMLILAGTLSYASVPLYRAICSRTGFGGTPITDSNKFTPERMQAVDRSQRIRVKFSSEVSSQIPWTFKPEQREVAVLPGETALAFYKAKNTSSDPIIGMATYTVVPERAAAYFSKIQCFCFEEQLLMPGEEVDMPLFFFIDPDYARDPAMTHIHDIVLHYTFFKAQYKNREQEKEIVSALASQFAKSQREAKSKDISASVSFQQAYTAEQLRKYYSMALVAKPALDSKTGMCFF